VGHHAHHLAPFLFLLLRLLLLLSFLLLLCLQNVAALLVLLLEGELVLLQHVHRTLAFVCWEVGEQGCQSKVVAWIWGPQRRLERLLELVL
jgi:hypothetical protein